MTGQVDDRDMLVHATIGFIEWCCWKCGASGLGFMPEEHASGACEHTTLVRHQFRMVQEVARQAQEVVRDVLGGAPHFVDGAGI